MYFLPNAAFYVCILISHVNYLRGRYFAKTYQALFSEIRNII